MSNVPWADDRITTLSKLWQDGLSASQIAKQLGGVTRNAVIGKIHRLGLSGRATPSRPKGAAGIRNARPLRPVRPPPLVFSAPVERPPEGPGLVAAMTGLGAHACKWPIGDPKAEGFTFCGRPAEGVYCAGHAQTAYRPGKPKPLHREAEVRRLLRALAA